MLLYVIYTTVASLLLFVQVVSILVLEPTDVFAVRNSTVSLSCYTNLSGPVSWEIKRTGGNTWELIYKGDGDIPGMYQYRYSVSNVPKRGQYNLTIRGIELEDSGTYRCTDNSDQGQRMYKEGVPGNRTTAELVICDDEIKCRHENNFNQVTTGSNYSGLIKISCNMTYRGNTSPNLIWFLRNHETDESGKSLQSYSRSFATTEGANSKLESEISLNASAVPQSTDQFYVVCEAMGRGKTLLTWISEKIANPTFGQDSISSTALIVIIVMASLLGLFFVVVIVLLICYLRRKFCAAGGSRSNSDIMVEELLMPLADPAGPEEVKMLEIPPIAESNVSLPSVSCTVNGSQPRITGVAVVDDKIYVVGSGQSSVSVHTYNLINGKYIYTKLKDVKIPNNGTTPHEDLQLAGCNHNKILYIGNDHRHYIHRIDVETNKPDSDSPGWNLEGNHKLHGLSVTAEHTLLVTVWIRDTADESLVIEYTDCIKGERKNEIPFDESIKHAYHTMQLSFNRFVVCHAVDTTLHRVCLINSEGKIEKSYGKEQGEGEGFLKGPFSLAIINNGQYICVTDCENNRVQVLDTQLTYLGEVKTPYTPRNLKKPVRLCFDPLQNRLLVGEKGSHRVVIIIPPVPKHSA